MKIGIMQPYIFPYIGYFQLIAAVDRFVVYDDVTFIKQGWINRNRVLANGNPLYFSIPLSGASSHALIKDVRVNSSEYDSWRIKFFKTLAQYYQNAPQYKFVLPLIQDVLVGHPELIAQVALNSLIKVCSFIGIATIFVESSAKYVNNHYKSQERVIDICHRENAKEYINAIGGADLYSKEQFRSEKIQLSFLKSNEIKYRQFKDTFVPWLSIIDVLMFNSPEEVLKHLSSYELE